jgi:hypothetical protein
MTSPHRSQFRRSVAAGIAVAALAAPVAQAAPIIEPGSGATGPATAAQLRTDAAQAGGAQASTPALTASALRTDAAQAGGATAPAVAPQPIVVEAPPVTTTVVDDGFDWGAAAIGAGVSGALILLAMASVAGVSRVRMRTVR